MNWTSRPFFFASGSSRLHKNYYYHSCRSLILGAWELWICFGEIKGFGAFRLHYTRCAFRRPLDIGCLRYFALAQRRERRVSAKRSSHSVCPSFLCLRHLAGGNSALTSCWFFLWIRIRQERSEERNEREMGGMPIECWKLVL